MEICQGEGIIPEVQSLGPRNETAVPSKETGEIKKLRKEQQRLLNKIKQLQQQIRVLKMGKNSKGTSGAKHVTTQAKPHKKKTKRTQVKPVIQNRKEQHLVVANIEAQTDNTPICDKEVQTEELKVHEKET